MRPDSESDRPRDGLVWTRSPVEWDTFEPADEDAVVRVFYVQAGTANGPGAAIAEVLVSESREAVSITLVEREIGGTYPDGSIAARATAALPACMEVALSAPLGDRKLIDGSTGKRARRLGHDAEEHGWDWQAIRDEQGCPRWMP